MTEVAERAGLTRAAARRFLLTLQELGYVGESAGYFYLRPRILDLGYGYIASVRIEELVEPMLEEVADKTKAAVHFAVLDDDQALFIAGVPSRLMASTFLGVGARMPAYAGSLGQVLLAWQPSAQIDSYLKRTVRVIHTSSTIIDAKTIRARLADVRRLGYAVNTGEYIEGIVSVAIPVRNRNGDVIAALNVNRYSPRPLDQSEIDTYLDILRQAVNPIEKAFRSDHVKQWGDLPLG